MMRRFSQVKRSKNICFRPETEPPVIKWQIWRENALFCVSHHSFNSLSEGLYLFYEMAFICKNEIVSVTSTFLFQKRLHNEIPLTTLRNVFMDALSMIFGITARR